MSTGPELWISLETIDGNLSLALCAPFMLFIVCSFSVAAENTLFPVRLLLLVLSRPLSLEFNDVLAVSLLGTFGPILEGALLSVEGRGTMRFEIGS